MYRTPLQLTEVLRGLVKTSEGRACLGQYLDKLSVRERTVIELLLGINGEQLSGSEIARKLGVTRHRIYQNQQRALSKLSSWSKGELFTPKK